MGASYAQTHEADMLFLTRFPASWESAKKQLARSRSKKPLRFWFLCAPHRSPFAALTTLRCDAMGRSTFGARSQNLPRTRAAVHGPPLGRRNATWRWNAKTPSSTKTEMTHLPCLSLPITDHNMKPPKGLPGSCKSHNSDVFFRRHLSSISGRSSRLGLATHFSKPGQVSFSSASARPKPPVTSPRSWHRHVSIPLASEGKPKPAVMDVGKIVHCVGAANLSKHRLSHGAA